MPMRMILDFERLGSESLSASYGKAMHDMFFEMISRVDESFSALLHENEDARPFALSSELSENHRFRICVSTLNDNVGYLIRRILGRLVGEEARLDIMTLLLSEIINEREESKEELFTRATAIQLDSGFILHFLTPIAFKHDGQYIAMPLLDVLLSGLARREAQWLGRELPDLKVRIDDNVHPISFQLATKTLPVRSGSEEMNGCIGFCRYAVSFHHDDPALELLKLLLAIIPYTGLGAKTAMGMGSVDVRICKTRRT